MTEQKGRVRAILGLDTSYYTTSAALVDTAGARLADARRSVAVPAGARGLAQSEAVFRHLLSLPEVFEQALAGAAEVAGGPVKVAVVAATVAPRPEMGSYMPVFKVAEGFGRSLAAALGVPMVAVTHQEGHLRAGLETSEAGRVLAAGKRLLALHLSGGTSELLLLEPLMGARRGRKRPLFEVILLGGTIDLHAGQFLDHLGVHMGLPFPAGAHLEQLAEQGRGENGGGDNGREPVTLPVSGGRRDERYFFSLSGPLSAAYRALEAGATPADVAAAAQRTLAKALEKMVRPAIEATGIRDVLIVGGVASNRYLRGRLAERLGHRAVGGRLYFPDPALCVDNAIGVAWQGAAVARPGR
ncbi:MAG: Kae1-like domain-containing protein [Bacillota bacterium]